jgi:K+-sensing histidine kinase KdpD
MFRTGLIVVWPDSNIDGEIASRYYHEYKDFQRSTQWKGEQKLPYLNMIHYCLTAISVLLMIIMLSGRKNLDPNLVNLIIIIVVGIFLNAMITGTIGGAIHRYQARVNWLLVFAGIIIAGYYLKQFVIYIKRLDLPVKKD